MMPAKVYISALAVIFLVGFGFSYSMAAPPADWDQGNTEARILAPGMASSCHSDFVVENIDNGAAELQVILGNEEFLRDQIGENASKAYGLKHSLSKAKMEGKKVELDDVATIFNTDDKSYVRVYCQE